MPTRKSPRKGSLQFWPRKRASKFLPRVNWSTINSENSDSSKGLKGFICYKAGMCSAFVKNNTEHSLTKGKRISVPVTIVECPPMKIFSVRFYKNGIVAKEILSDSLDKDLRKKVKVPKAAQTQARKALEGINPEEYDDLHVIVYSQAKKTGLKKTPDLSEIGLFGSFQEKLDFVKENIGKDLNASDFFKPGNLVDARGLTKGYGFQGPVKRFGLKLKNHKSEKGRRRPGSLGPWHPARVTFRAPQAGQLGMFSRLTYNVKIIGSGKGSDIGSLGIKSLKNYGNVKTDYLILSGSVHGPSKRQLLITQSFRPTKRTNKKNYEILELR